jgi:protein-S-isoprenylcysteine O-methyltransferase Ste14
MALIMVAEKLPGAVRLPAYAYIIAIAASLAWATPFPLFRSRVKGALTVDRRARWGMLLQCAGYTLLWQGPFWAKSPAIWQTIVATLLLSLACLISWTAMKTLGRQLRVDAALDSGHELVRSGPYRIVRHPIYTSMLCLVTGTGILIATMPFFIAALAAFLTGTEIRMRIEDALLASRFGEEFRHYKAQVPALIPGLR